MADPPTRLAVGLELESARTHSAPAAVRSSPRGLGRRRDRSRFQPVRNLVPPLPTTTPGLGCNASDYIDHCRRLVNAIRQRRSYELHKWPQGRIFGSKRFFSHRRRARRRRRRIRPREGETRTMPLSSRSCGALTGDGENRVSQKWQILVRSAVLGSHGRTATPARQPMTQAIAVKRLAFNFNERDRCLDVFGTAIANHDQTGGIIGRRIPYQSDNQLMRLEREV